MKHFERRYNHSLWVILWILTAVIITLCNASSHVTMINNGPVVMGSPIRFTANVTFHDEPVADQLMYDWWDNFEPPHRHSIGPTSNTTVNYTLTFPNKHVTKIYGSYLMGLKVYQIRAGRRDKLLGEWYSPYTITRMLGGQIEITQLRTGIKRSKHVATGIPTRMIAHVVDPMEYLKKANSIDYVWSLNGNSNIGPNDLPIISYNFTEVGPVIVRCVVAARFLPNTTSVSPDDRELVTGATDEHYGYVDEALAHMVYGVFSATIEVNDPVTYIHVTGDTSLRNGALLNLTMSCNGSSPWYYCVHIEHGSYNITGNETCSSSSNIEDKCYRRYYRYLANNSSYTAVFVIGNDVSKRVAKVDISVNMLPVQQLSYYIVPLSCAMLALVFIMFGSIKLVKSRRDYNLEIADFDFEPSSTASGEFDSGEVSFWRRVHYTVMPDTREWWRRVRTAVVGSLDTTTSTERTLSSESDPILARERSQRLSYGIVEGYSDED